MSDSIVARGYGRLLAERWRGRTAPHRVVEFQLANPGDCPRVALVLSFSQQPAAREHRNGGHSSGLGRGAHGFWTKVRKDPVLAPGGCWIWTGALDKDGAGKFCTVINGERRYFRAPRRAWELMLGDPNPPTLIALCGIAACVNPDHRKPIEHTVLVRTLHELGRPFEYADNRGEMSGRTHLRNDDVLFIRSQPKAYGLAPLLASLFGVTPQVIHCIRIRRTWRHLGNGNKANAMSLAALRGLIASRARDRTDLVEAATARNGEIA